MNHWRNIFLAILIVYGSLTVFVVGCRAVNSTMKGTK